MIPPRGGEGYFRYGEADDQVKGQMTIGSMQDGRAHRLVLGYRGISGRRRHLKAPPSGRRKERIIVKQDRSDRHKTDMWQAFRDYGALFAPWVAGKPNPPEPLSDARIAPLRLLTQRYGTGTALAWITGQRMVTNASRSFADLALIYGRAKAARQLDTLEALVRALNDAGIVPLLLKGAAAQVAGLYPDPGFRLMADIDLLVPVEQIDAAIAAAQSRGFAPMASPEGASSHAYSLYNTQSSMLLEIHWRIARVHARDTFPAHIELASARPVDFRATRVLSPDWTRHAALTILHAVAWHRSRYMALVPIKALLDIAALKASGVAVSWPGVVALLDEADERDSLVHFELLFHTLFGSPLTGIAIPPWRRAWILRYYALGAAHPGLHHVGLALSQFHERLLRVRRQPERLAQLLRPRFYRNLAEAMRRAFDPKSPLH